jgi:hypothetical protein
MAKNQGTVNRARDRALIPMDFSAALVTVPDFSRFPVVLSTRDFSGAPGTVTVIHAGTES